jgi:hypothetical protein
MYPHGHPSRAAAADAARHVLTDLFRSVDRVDVAVSPHGLTCADEELVDEDGLLRRMASFLRSRRIGCITIERGLTDDEVDLLLDLVAAASGAEDGRDIVQRVAESEAEFLHLVEIDYDSFIPASEAGEQSAEPAPVEGEEDSGGPSASPEGELAAALAAADGVALLKLLEEPSELTQALLSSMAAAFEDENGGSPDGADPAAGMLSTADELGQLQAAGAALAGAVQRLAEGACSAQPDDQDGVFAKLSAALRPMEPRLLGFAFRADVVDPGAPFDALRETARHLTIEEAVDIACAPLGAIEAETLEVCGRLIDRLAPTPERLTELSAALKQALAERGLSADGLVTVLEASLQQFASPQAPGEPVAGSPEPRLRKTPEDVRAERRAALASRLPSASEAEGRARRIAACAELLVLPQLPGQFTALLADLRESLSNVADDLKPDLETTALKALAGAAQPSNHLPAERRAEVCSLIDDIANSQAVERLRRSLDQADSDGRLRILRALSLIRQGGHAAVTSLLLNGYGLQEEQEAAAITVILVDAEEAGLSGPVGLSDVIGSPACRHANSVIRALAARGGERARKHLAAALAHGEYAVRRMVVDAAGQAETPIAEVLVMALADAEEDISVAAVRYLADSGDQQAARHLLGVLRAAGLLRPRFGRRTAAAEALGALKYEPAVDCLAGVLRRSGLTRRTENDRLRAAAARALVAIGTPPALHAVAARRHGERSQEIRELAISVADRLADEPPGLDHAEEDSANAI